MKVHQKRLLDKRKIARSNPAPLVNRYGLPAGKSALPARQRSHPTFQKPGRERRHRLGSEFVLRAISAWIIQCGFAYYFTSTCPLTVTGRDRASNYLAKTSRAQTGTVSDSSESSGERYAYAQDGRILWKTASFSPI